MSATQASSAPYDASFKPETYLKVLDEFEAAVRDENVFVPDEFTDEEQMYVRAYVTRKYREYGEEYCLPGIAAMRTYLQDEEKPAESKEFETLIYFKHKARGMESLERTMTYTMKLRYHPEELLDGYISDEDDEDRWRRQEYLDSNGGVVPAPPSTDPVETDPEWDDISDYVREYALTAFLQKLGPLIEICGGAECGIRSDQRTRQVRADRIKRGVKQIMKNEGNRYTIKEIPITDPIPEGYRECNY